MLGKLKLKLYGTRDGGAIWEECYASCLIGLGFKQGKASPCSFVHTKWNVSVVVHGDDFTALGTDESIELTRKDRLPALSVSSKGELVPRNTT